MMGGNERVWVRVPFLMGRWASLVATSPKAGLFRDIPLL